jgi:hypothetical protein
MNRRLRCLGPDARAPARPRPTYRKRHRHVPRRLAGERARKSPTQDRTRRCSHCPPAHRRWCVRRGREVHRRASVLANRRARALLPTPYSRTSRCVGLRRFSISPYKAQADLSPAPRLRISLPSQPGEVTTRPAFWSHAVASQFAATVTGSAPPMTNPKKRPLAEAIVASEPISSSSATTASAVDSCSGNACSKSASAASASLAGATERVSRDSR